MNKAAKISLLILLGLPLMVILAVISFFLIKDANDFKPAIEEQAKKAAGINLSIQGDLSWSLIPLGLDIHQISIKDQNFENFASAERILASIDFWSLFEGKPKVQTILLDGLDLNLIQISETENNWSKLLPSNEAQSSKEKTATAPQESNQSKIAPDSSQAEDMPQNSLNFLVESFKLSNTRIRYESKVDELLLAIDPLNLTLSDITFNQAFPVSLDFALTEKKNQLKIDSTLKGQLTITNDLTLFRLEQMDNEYRISAPQFAQNEVRLAINSNLQVDTKAETVNINDLILALNQLRLKANATINNYSGDLKVKADLEVPSFPPKKLLADMNVQLPKMQAADALDRLSLTANINVENQKLTIDSLKFMLDESSWQGDITHMLAAQAENQATTIKLHGDKLNVDRYLPPADDSNATPTPPPAAATGEKDSGLLPLETLRNLNLDIRLLLDTLLVKNIETTNILLSFTAKDGKLNQNLQGKLFEGSYNLTNKIDAQSSVPRWSSEQSISKLNLAPLMKTLDIQALKEYGSLAGILNFQGSLNTSGNQVEALQAGAKGKFDFNIEQGAFEGISLNTYTCQGLALINREAIDTSSWPNATSFNTLNGSATIENQQLATRFDIITAGVHADSQGQINLETSELNIKAALKVIGESLDKACRVNEKLKTVGIPLVCKGKFDTPPGKLCKLDTSRLGDMAKDLAVEEGKRKLSKEVDRALEKHLGGEDKAPVKSLLKKLIK